MTVHLRWGSSEAARLVPLREQAKWVKKRSTDEGVFDRDILVVWDMIIPSCDSELFKTVCHYGLKLPDGLSGLEASEATTNLARTATYDQILPRATNPDPFTDQARVVRLLRGRPRAPVSGSRTRSRLHVPTVQPFAAVDPARHLDRGRKTRLPDREFRPGRLTSWVPAPSARP